MEVYNAKLLRQDPIETFTGFGGRTARKVKLFFTNGLERFQGDAYDFLADKLASEPLDYNKTYNVQIELSIREKKDEATGDVRYFNQVRIINVGMV